MMVPLPVPWMPQSFSKGGRKGGGKGKKNIGMVRRTGKTDPERVCWIGGLAGKSIDKEFNKKLKAFIEKAVGEGGVKFVDINEKGEGGAIFGSAEECQAAIESCNGKKFMGKTLVVDPWTPGFKGDDE